MAYPTYYPFKTRVLTATSSTTPSPACFVVVPARARYVQALIGNDPRLSHTAATNQVDISINGSTMATMGDFAITTSTGNTVTTVVPTTNLTVLNAGDVLGTWGSSVAGLVVTHILQEF
jgi:hypothetical protein